MEVQYRVPGAAWLPDDGMSIEAAGRRARVIPTRRGAGLGRGQKGKIAESRFWWSWWWWLKRKGISTVRKRYQRNRAYVIKRRAWMKCEVASFWDGDASLSDQIHAAGSSGSRVMPAMSSMSPRSCWDRVDWWALGENRGKEDDGSDAFVCVIVELTCCVSCQPGMRSYKKGSVRTCSLD